MLRDTGCAHSPAGDLIRDNYKATGSVRRKRHSVGSRKQLSQPWGKAGCSQALQRRGDIGRPGSGAWQRCLSAGLEEGCDPQSRKSPRQQPAGPGGWGPKAGKGLSPFPPGLLGPASLWPWCPHCTPRRKQAKPLSLGMKDSAPRPPLPVKQGG